MEFQIKQTALKEALQTVAGCIEKSRAVEILGFVLLETLGEGTLRVTASDIDITITTEVEADIVKPGAICIEGRKVSELVRALPAGGLRFVEADGWMRLEAGRSKYKIATRPASDFPERVRPPAESVAIATEVLRAQIRTTAFATTKDTSAKFTLAAHKIEIEQGDIRMIATDGYRLAIADGKCDNRDVTIDALIPIKAAVEVSKIPTSVVHFSEDANHLFFVADTQTIVARKSLGRFPEYRKMEPKDGLEQTVRFNADDMRQAIRRAAILTDEKNRSIRVEVMPGEISVQAVAYSGAEADERIEADYDGPAVALGFTVQYIADFFSVIDPEARIEMQFAEGTRSVVLSVVDDETYRCVVFTVNLAIQQQQVEAKAAA